MSELINTNKYLDFSGLKKYDGLIKDFIASGNVALADAIAALDAKIGSIEFEGSDEKTLSEVVDSIYSSIVEIVGKQDSLDEKDAEIEGKINDIIGDLESLEGSNAVKTLVEISNNLKSIEDSVSKNAQDIAGVTTRVDVLEQTVADLGAIDGGEGLAGVVNKVNTNTAAIEILNGEGDGSVKKVAEDAAAQALADAKADAAALNEAMDVRVAVLEAIDHEQLAADAVAAVVAGADSDFDTLKEVADWIASDKEGSAALQISVSKNAEDITKLDAKVDADIKNLADHMTEASVALGEVDERLVILESFVESYESISETDIEDLFA